MVPCNDVFDEAHQEIIQCVDVDLILSCLGIWGRDGWVLD